MVTPNRIRLISHGRYGEALVTAANTIYPGMSLAYQSDGTIAPASATDPGPAIIAEEDALQGKDITQPMAAGQLCPFWYGVPGDRFLMLLKSGQTSVQGSVLYDDGTGLLQTTGTGPPKYKAVDAFNNSGGTGTGPSASAYIRVEVVQ